MSQRNLSAISQKRISNTHHKSSKSKADLMSKKGIYPYDYMDSFDKFNDTQLPSKEQFYSQLNNEHISYDDYKHAKKVWGGFNLKNMGQYHDLIF